MSRRCHASEIWATSSVAVCILIATRVCVTTATQEVACWRGADNSTKAPLSATLNYLPFDGALSRPGPDGFPFLLGYPARVLPLFPPLVRFPLPRLARLPLLFPLDFGIVLSSFVKFRIASVGHIVSNQSNLSFHIAYLARNLPFTLNLDTKLACASPAREIVPFPGTTQVLTKRALRPWLINFYAECQQVGLSKPPERFK